MDTQSSLLPQELFLMSKHPDICRTTYSNQSWSDQSDQTQTTTRPTFSRGMGLKQEDTGFSVAAPILWDSLLVKIRLAPSLLMFQKLLKMKLFWRDFPWFCSATFSFYFIVCIIIFDEGGLFLLCFLYCRCFTWFL